ncbi:hypothetical protein QAD02_018082 [Eretmocerus hayati]|uniref:Uncharacterized protein n=1 Tax=Eretmocerus hayati TaxID=131215 RepID=A0ACC2PKI5_9HYME|nr:hypothetical protein QAD02_018082 [Eretmocerus hayati]
MQHQYWITKQTLSRKFGRKEDECIVLSDAQLDSKLELFRNIQTSCTLMQKVIDKYQESICYLSQEMNTMGRFLKEKCDEDKSQCNDAMIAIGKFLIFCAQQQLSLHEPLIRFHQELKTFRRRAIGDTYQKVVSMEKARTDYRASLSWLKNVSPQLDPDTTKQLEKFKKVQDKVRRNKVSFDQLAHDCSQKVDLLAAARCNMLNHILTFYQTKFISYSKKSAKTYSIITEVSKNQTQDTKEQTYFKKLEISESSNNESIEEESKNQQSSLQEHQTLLIDGIPPNESIDPSKNEISQVQNILDAITDQSEKSRVESTASIFDIDSKSWDNCLNLSSEMSSGGQEDMSSPNKTIEWNTSDFDNFLPPALLKKSLKDVTSHESSNKKVRRGKTEAQSEQSSNTSWMDLFKDLDPLSNNMTAKNHKATDQESSSV